MLWYHQLHKDISTSAAKIEMEKNGENNVYSEQKINDYVSNMVDSMVDRNYISPEMIPALLKKLKPPLGIIDFKIGAFSRA